MKYFENTVLGAIARQAKISGGENGICKERRSQVSGESVAKKRSVTFSAERAARTPRNEVKYFENTVLGAIARQAKISGGENGICKERRSQVSGESVAKKRSVTFSAERAARTPRNEVKYSNNPVLEAAGGNKQKRRNGKGST